MIGVLPGFDRWMTRGQASWRRRRGSLESARPTVRREPLVGLLPSVWNVLHLVGCLPNNHLFVNTQHYRLRGLSSSTAQFPQKGLYQVWLANFWFWEEHGKIWKICSWAVPKDLDPDPDLLGKLRKMIYCAKFGWLDHGARTGCRSIIILISQIRKTRIRGVRRCMSVMEIKVNIWLLWYWIRREWWWWLLENRRLGRTDVDLGGAANY